MVNSLVNIAVWRTDYKSALAGAVQQLPDHLGGQFGGSDFHMFNVGTWGDNGSSFKLLYSFMVEGSNAIKAFQFWNTALNALSTAAPSISSMVHTVSINEDHNRIGFVPLGHGKNYGAYQSANYRAKIRIRGNQNELFVGVSSTNTPVSGGQVVFSAAAYLKVDGNVIQKIPLVNGNARFIVPNGQDVSLKVKGGWTVFYDSGGASVPTYIPYLPAPTLNFTDNFIIR